MAQKKTIKRNQKAKKKNDGTVIPDKLTRYHYFAALIVAVYALLLYINTIGHGYVLDDYSAITINRFVQEGFAGIPKLLQVDFWHFSNMQLGYYRPLSLITFAMEYQFFGFAPEVSHFINTVLFAAITFIVFLLLIRIFPSSNKLFPLIITLLFASHPIHTEVINNIKGRDELLSFLNTVTMLYFVILYSKTKKTGFLLIGMFLFYLALLSKESALTGILLIPLFLYFSNQGKWSEVIKNTAPFLIIIFFFLIQKRIALGELEPVIPNDLINYPYRLDVVKYSSTFLLFLYSIRILVFPYPLRYDYSYNQISAVDWTNGWAWIGLVLFFTLLVFAILQLKKGKPFGIAFSFFYITIIPMMAFVLMRGGIFAERNLFAPSLGFCIVLGIILEKFRKNDPDTASASNYTNWIKSNWIYGSVIIVILAYYSYTTVSRNPAWKDNLTLFTNDLPTGKNSAQNQLHFGSELIMKIADEKSLEKKKELFAVGMPAIREAIKIHPGFGDAYFRYAYGFEVRMSYQQDPKDLDSAIYFFNRSIDFSPSLSDSYRHLGIIYEWLQRFDVASYYYNKAFEINPLSEEARQKADELRSTRGIDVRVNPLTGLP